MSTLDKVIIADTVYDISPSSSGTLDSNYISSDSDQEAATEYTPCEKINSTDTNAVIFNKLTVTSRNTKYLQNKIGNADITSVGGDITTAINTLQRNDENIPNTVIPIIKDEINKEVRPLIGADTDRTVFNSELVSRMTGTGTSSDPFLIYTPLDFYNVRNNLTAYYKLANNLDCSQLEWSPIATSAAKSFKGYFDGNGKTIKGIRYVGSTTAVSIFGHVGGNTNTDVACPTIKNLTIRDSELVSTSNGFLGGLTSHAYYPCLFEDISLNISLTAAANLTTVTGAFLSVASNTTTTNKIQLVRCSNYGMIQSAGQLGGLIGAADNCSLQSCFNAADLRMLNTSSTTFWGLGKAGNGNEYRNCYNVGTMRYTDGNIGGYAIANFTEASDRISNCCFKLGIAANSSYQGSVINAIFWNTDAVLNILNTNITGEEYVLTDEYPTFQSQLDRDSGMRLPGNFELLVDGNGDHVARKSGITIDYVKSKFSSIPSIIIKDYTIHVGDWQVLTSDSKMANITLPEITSDKFAVTLIPINNVPIDYNITAVNNSSSRSIYFLQKGNNASEFIDVDTKVRLLIINID